MVIKKAIKIPGQKHKKIITIYTELDKAFKRLTSTKFPECRGSYPDCPDEETIKKALKEKRLPKECKLCPVGEKYKKKIEGGT